MRERPRPERLDPAAVCSLPPDDLQERLAWVRREILRHAVAREEGPDWVAWELAEVPGLAAALDHLVALEARCCGAIGFAHRPGARADRRRLEVSGVDPRAGIFATDGAVP